MIAGDPESPADPGLAEAPTAALLRPGQKWFERFTLQRLVGRGGMGLVWLALDEMLGRQVALKFLPDALRSEAAALENLRQEARKSLELTHPHIVRVHDLVTDADGAAISMEYVDGPTLSQLRQRQPHGAFAPAVLVPWVEQLCAALDYAHQEARLVHRDLKPANLMLNSRGKLKVTDFGIARSLHDSVSRLTGRRVAGTLAYMSPQQLQGEPPAPTDDIYSLGATLFELLAGTPPFHTGDVVGQVLTQLAPRINRRLSEVGSAAAPVPESWEQTIAACLAKDPTPRPQSAGEVAARLGLAAPARARAVTHPGVAPRTLVGRPRFPKSAAVGVSVAMLAAGLGLLWLGQRHRMPKSTPARPAAFTNSLGMGFVPVPGTELLFSIWETRVQDFAAFAEDTGQAPQPMLTHGPTGYAEKGHTWQSPGFEQGPTHPVCGVSVQDARAFCEWLTRRERRTGRIKQDQSYRLPRFAEWRRAVASEGPFAWGEAWPPPAGSGNFGGEELRTDPAFAELQGKNQAPIPGYNDGFARTAPVGSFAPNRLGLHDLVGNVHEWLDETFVWQGLLHQRITAGSWTRGNTPNRFFKIDERSGYVVPGQSQARVDHIGFRCVLAPENAPAPATTIAPTAATPQAALSEAERAEGFRPLFNGVDLSGWQPRYPTRPHGWAAENGTLINHFTNRVNPNDLFTTERFWNFVLRYEYFIPPDPPRVFNSGVFLRGRYEIQIGADRSVTNGVPTKNSNAALDNFKPADVFVPCAWGAWHEVEATLVGHRLTVRLNGIKVHDDVELTRPTGGQLDDYVDQPGPILLQGLYCAAVFRNLRIRPLP